jgi:Ni2+-binding GTPase involved in maturation of urease and hydrogenase
VIQEARGNVTEVATTKTVNFCFVFGCFPGSGTAAKTQLIMDLTEHLKSTAKECVIPSVFDRIKSSDAGFETIVSNMG